MLLITFAITGIAWLSQSLKFIDFIVNKGLSFTKFLYLSSLIVPSLLFVVIPVALFISIIFAFNKLSNESELVIYKAAGIDNLGLLKPAIAFSLMVTLVSYLISLYLLPNSYRQFKDMQNFIRNNYASILIQEGVFSNPTKDLTIFIKERDKTGVFKGLILHNSKDPNREVTMTAQEGYLENTKKGPVFVLLKGSHQELNRNTGKTSMLFFEKYNLFFDLLQNTAIDPNRWREPEERYLQELFFVKEPDQKRKMKLTAEGNQRIIWPLANFILSMLAVFPFLVGNFSRRGNTKNIAKTCLVAVVFLLIQVAFKNLVSKHIIFAFMMYFEVFLFGIVLYLAIFKDGLKFSKISPSPF
jgi:lipopolysaccharide export system permease protein